MFCASGTILGVNKVTVKRDNYLILNAIDWVMQSGENWIVLGPNGSGKTTLFKLLLGYMFPTTGKVTVLGDESGYVNFPETRKMIGWVSHSLEAMIHREDPAIEIVLSGLRGGTRLWHHVNQAERTHALQLLQLLDAAHVAERGYGLLSQGEREKVLIARALVNAPRVLILDEPCAGLDMASRERLLESLASIEGMECPPQLLMSTHHVEEISPLFTHALLMKDGLRVSSGKINEVISSKSMSDLFGMPLMVKRANGRFQAIIQSGFQERM